MQLTASARRALLVTLVAVAVSVSAVAVGVAALERTSVTFGGPGVTTAGREISLKVTATNAGPDRAVTPDEVARIRVDSPSVRFNGDSDSVSTCRARLPTDGDTAACPKSSRVGDGAVAGTIGEPGKPVNMYGALSDFRGKLRLFNYRHPGGQPARILAVVSASKPFRGVAINLVLPVSRYGVVTVDIPKFSQLPRLIRKSYPKGTRLVLTKFSARIVSPPKTRGLPFLSLRKRGQMSAEIEAVGR